MKIAALALLPLTLFTLSAQAYVCNERDAKSAITKEVIIEEVADITKNISWGEEFDKVAIVKVTVNAVKNGKRAELLSFKAFAKYADVFMGISAVKKHGFSMWQYFDEEDEDGAEITYSNGQKETILLTCHDGQE